MLTYSSGNKFTTFDRDNDNYINPKYNDSCAVLTQGGFWWPACGYALLNGAAGYFFYTGLPNGIRDLKTCRMSLLCR